MKIRSAVCLALGFLICGFCGTAWGDSKFYKVLTKTVSSSSAAAWGLSNIDFDPDGKLWIFDGPGGQIRIIDSVDGLFFNGNDVVSDRFGSSNNGNVFDLQGNLVSFDAVSDGTIRRPTDGHYFDDNDVIDAFTLPIDAARRGTGEPVGADFDAEGVLYTVGRTIPDAGAEVRKFTPTGDDLSDGSTATILTVPQEAGCSAAVLGLTFGPGGDMFLSELTYKNRFLGIAPNDGVFFNGNDSYVSYSADDNVDLAFDARGDLFLVNSDQGVIDLYSIPAPATLGVAYQVTYADYCVKWGAEIESLLAFFQNIDSEGDVTIDKLDANDPILPATTPPGIAFWQITVSGGFDLGQDGTTKLIFNYNESLIPEGFTEADLTVMHWNGSEWVNVFAAIDTVENLITAIGVNSFSPFVIAYDDPVPEPATLLLLAVGGLAMLKRKRKF